MISSEQSRAARALLNWSQADLATESQLSESTIRDFEKGRRMPSEQSLAMIEDAFAEAGISFIANGGSSREGGEGVRFTVAQNVEDIDAKLASLQAVIDELMVQSGMIQKDLNDRLDKDFADRRAHALAEVAHYLDVMLEQRQKEFAEIVELKEALEREDRLGAIKGQT